MPELPDIVVYVEAIAARTLGATLEQVRLGNPFLLRSVEPPLAAVEGKMVRSVSRIGKRIVLGIEDDIFLVIHLMIAGRLHWERHRGAEAEVRRSGVGPASRVGADSGVAADSGVRAKTGVGAEMTGVGAELRLRPPALPKGRGLAAFDFSTGTLTLTEAGSKRRASLTLVRGEEALRAIHRGGLDVMQATLDAFREALTRENHTLKRALTDPRLFDGIGNAYSDEILHAARLSPLQLSRNLSEDELTALHGATRSVLAAWTDRLRKIAAGAFPEKVTAFREGMAVHGRFGKPCPVCGAPVQRIVYSENEANYCARCQTGGRLLADRALSRLLREDWPKRLEE